MLLVRISLYYKIGTREYPTKIEYTLVFILINPGQCPLRTRSGSPYSH